MNKLLLNTLIVLTSLSFSAAAPLVGVTNGSKVTFFDSDSPGTLDKFAGDNSGSNEYLNGYQVFDSDGKIIGNLIDITVAPDGTFYGMTQNGEFYKFSDFGRYQNNQLGFKMELVKSNLPSGSVDFVNANTIGILSNNTLKYYDTTSFNLISQENINGYAGLAFDNGKVYSIKFSPSPSNLAEINGNNLVLVPNGNQQSDVAGGNSMFYMTVNGQILIYDGNTVKNKGSEYLTLRSVDLVAPEPTTCLLIGAGLCVMLFKRNRIG